jgi:hypothetical protein
MATSSKVSPQQLTKALRTLSYDRTRELVFHLGVEVYVLENIDTTFTGRTRSIQAIQAWLDRDTEASWETIVSGLIQIGKNVLARQVATQHCPQLLAAASLSTDVFHLPTPHPLHQPSHQTSLLTLLPTPIPHHILSTSHPTRPVS